MDGLMIPFQSPDQNPFRHLPTTEAHQRLAVAALPRPLATAIGLQRCAEA